MQDNSYYARHRESCLAKVKEYREKNKQYYKAYYDVWYQKNRDKLLEKRKGYRATKPKPIRQQKQQFTAPIELPVFLEPQQESNVTIVQQDFIVKFD